MLPSGSSIPPLKWKKISLFTVFPNLGHFYTPAISKLHLFMSLKTQLEDWGRSSTEGFFSFFFLSSKLWLFKERKLQKALINGSRDAHALSHSVAHNRQTYEAEPGMEYWKNEWKRTQIRDPTITPVHSEPLLFIVHLCWGGSAAGVPFSINYWGSKRHGEEPCREMCYWVFRSSETPFLSKCV